MSNGYCLICFKPLFHKSSLSFLMSSSKICLDCLNKFKVLDKKEIIDSVEYYFLYSYNEFAKQIVYKYKGCYDLALKDVFLNDYKYKIEKEYKGYTIIYPPSSNEDNIKRKYKHIKEIVNNINLKNEDLFYKIKTYKQSDVSYNKRYLINDIIKIKKDINITNKKYLIVDDIFTSGNTLKCIINLLVTNSVDIKNIKCLVLFKTSL